MRSVIFTALTLAALAIGGAALAQNSRPTGGPAATNGCTCPNPINFRVVKNTGATSGVQADFPSNFAVNQMTYSDGRADLHFGDSISWTLPRGACQVTRGVVTWKVKNMAANSIQDNDSTGLWFGGAQLPGSGHTVAMPPGQVLSFSHTLTPAEIRNGRVSLAAQDDTAVIEFTVEIQGCCVTPNIEPGSGPLAGNGRG